MDAAMREYMMKATSGDMTPEELQQSLRDDQRAEMRYRPSDALRDTRPDRARGGARDRRSRRRCGSAGLSAEGHEAVHHGVAEGVD